MAYEINYNDDRFQQVNNEKQNALDKISGTYDEMINNSDSKYQDMIDASKEWANKQQELQQENTDFIIGKIEQEKDQAKKDYTKEQKGSYVDYQKATNQYGANAEAMASQGMSNTGFSESTNTQAFTTYQNRYASARETYNQAIMNYNNNIKEAELANNSTLAEIYFNAQKEQLGFALEQFQYKNQLLQSKLEAQRQTDNDYYNRWQNVLNQMNHENSLQEQIRQYNESMNLQREQFNWQKQQASKKSSGGSSRLTNGSGSSKLSNGSSSKDKNSSKSKNSSNLSGAGIGAVVGGMGDGWISAREMANSMGLPAAVNLDNVVSSKKYEKKKDKNGFAYYRQK